jgi:RNA polymerase sigma factor (sigma-70 family)
MENRSVMDITKEPPSQVSDRSLLQQVREGDEDAAAQLYLRYSRRLLALARAKIPPYLAARLDPDDILQSAFRTFFHQVRRGRYHVPAGEDLWNLLFAITLSKIRDEMAFHCAARRDLRQTTALADVDEAHVRDPRGGAVALPIQLGLREVLEKLPAPHRGIVELRLAGHEVVEIARQTGRSLRTVERVLQEARQKLHVLLGEN